MTEKEHVYFISNFTHDIIFLFQVCLGKKWWNTSKQNELFEAYQKSEI